MRLGFLVLLAATALAAPDATRDWKTGLRHLEARERKYWRAYQERFNQGRLVLVAEIDRAYAQPEQHKEATYDYSEFRKLYEDYDLIQQAMGDVDRAYAESRSPKALGGLFKTLLGVAKEVDALEKELRDAKPKMAVRIFHQQPAIRRQGLEIRRDALVAALARCRDAAAFLAHDGWRRAVSADGRRSIVRRVAVIDALGRDGTEPAAAALADLARSRESSLRIAVVEALMRFGPQGRPALLPLLEDPSPVVRRALLQEIRERGDPGWIGPLAEGFPEARGALRADHLRALEALTNQRFGHAPERWKEWFEEYRKEIERGEFDKEKIEIQEVGPAPAADAVAFYGIETLSKGLVWIVEASGRLAVPADWEIQRTKFRALWPGLRTRWERQYPSHQMVLQRELTQTLESCSEDTVFGIVALYGNWAVGLLDEKRLLDCGRRNLKAARKFVEKLPADGWCAQYEGLRRAARLAGMDPASGSLDFPDPRADTVFLFDSGDPRGGRYMAPEPVVKAFQRLNRFRRLVVHTIRICNEKEAGETLMKGIAEASGGTYVWMSKPPPAAGQ
ncbi:MAG: HEAT repeat domain-containing protein [Planctomycetota bacterium]|jgi:hypothetical protein